MPFPLPEPALAASLLAGRGDVGGLFAESRRLRDEGKGRVITYSPNVFIPVTTLCRDECGYCTFARPPGKGRYLEPDEVRAIAEAGSRLGCTEALLTMGDHPETRWTAARAFLESRGCPSTVDYAAGLAREIVVETGLFPHANPGVASAEEIARLRPWCASMGLMLESASARLGEPGGPHHLSPDKDPARRWAALRAMAAGPVPTTTGVLVGIGETPDELAESLFRLRELAAETGAVQEVIVQNFRAKPGTPMAGWSEPSPARLARAAAVARWVLGPTMNIQVPPNLTEHFEALLDAGVNDWGGVSPLTPDFVNPEAPWPAREELEARTAAAGFWLRARLPAYPEYLGPKWQDPAMLERLRAAADERGYARPMREAGRS